MKKLKILDLKMAITNLNNSKLNELKNFIENEIRLSEICISEGYEKKK